MKQHNYKKGDKVRIIGNNCLTFTGKLHEFNIGDIVTVENVNGDGSLLCARAADNKTQIVYPEHVELAEATFTRDDIKAGYLLEVKDERDGNTFYMTVIPSIKDPLGCCCPGKHWWPLSCFSEDKLTYRGCVFTATIMRVYGLAYNCDLLDNTPDGRKLLWERPEEPKVVEMTVAEISEKLGYEVKIVKEKIN